MEVNNNNYQLALIHLSKIKEGDIKAYEAAIPALLRAFMPLRC